MARGANEFTGVTNAPVTDGDGRLIVVSREDAPLLVVSTSSPVSNGAGSGTDADPYTFDVTLADGATESHSVVFLANGLVKSDTITTTPAP